MRGDAAVMQRRRERKGKGTKAKATEGCGSGTHPLRLHALHSRFIRHISSRCFHAPPPSRRESRWPLRRSVAPSLYPCDRPPFVPRSPRQRVPAHARMTRKLGCQSISLLRSSSRRGPSSRLPTTLRYKRGGGSGISDSTRVPRRRGREWACRDTPRRVCPSAGCPD